MSHINFIDKSYSRDTNITAIKRFQSMILTVAPSRDTTKINDHFAYLIGRIYQLDYGNNLDQVDTEILIKNVLRTINVDILYPCYFSDDIFHIFKANQQYNSYQTDKPHDDITNLYNLYYNHELKFASYELYIKLFETLNQSIRIFIGDIFVEFVPVPNPHLLQLNTFASYLKDDAISDRVAIYNYKHFAVIDRRVYGIKTQNNRLRLKYSSSRYYIQDNVILSKNSPLQHKTTLYALHDCDGNPVYIDYEGRTGTSIFYISDDGLYNVIIKIMNSLTMTVLNSPQNDHDLII